MDRLSCIGRFAGILVGGALLLLTTGANSDTVVTLGSKAADLERCVAPTSVMRRNHMDFLKHDRNKTVHQGIRDIPFSLAECVDCHAEKDSAGGYKPVNAEGQFCAACHDYVAVNITCFQCHRKTPERIGGQDTLTGERTGEVDRVLNLRPSSDSPLSLGRDELARLHATIKGN